MTSPPAQTVTQNYITSLVQRRLLSLSTVWRPDVAFLPHGIVEVRIEMVMRLLPGLGPSSLRVSSDDVSKLQTTVPLRDRLSSMAGGDVVSVQAMTV